MRTNEGMREAKAEASAAAARAAEAALALTAALRTVAKAVPAAHSEQMTQALEELPPPVEIEAVGAQLIGLSTIWDPD